MPMLDVSFMALDPMFADTFDVKRRTETVDVHGRTQKGSQDFTRVVGTVTQQSPSDLMRRDDSQIVPRRIFVATRFQLFNACKVGSQQYQPDLITWNGTMYTVTDLLPYSRFGKGFYEVIAQAFNAVDEPQ
jgi:galactose-6-phosphate isomerase